MFTKTRMPGPVRCNSGRPEVRAAAMNLLPLACLLLGGCGDATGPEPLVDPAADELQLVTSSLSVLPYPYWSESPTYPPLPGVLIIEALPQTGIEIPEGGVTMGVRVTTSAGDEEETVLWTPESICPREMRLMGGAHRVAIQIEGLDAARALASALAAVPAGFTGVRYRTDTDYAWAEVFVLNRSVTEAIKKLERADGVSRVYAQCGFPLEPPLRPTLYGGLPVEFGPARPGDGLLQYQSGMTISVEYQQPDGTLLVTEVVPEGVPVPEGG